MRCASSTMRMTEEGAPRWQGIAQPPSDFASPLDVTQRTLERERKVTALINRMYQIALEKSDYAAQVMLHQLINEQVEEEKVAEEIVDHLRIIEGDGTGFLILDSRLGERTAEA